MSDDKIPDDKPHYSASQIGLFEKCGMAYRFRYMEGIKTPPGIALIEGRATHQTIESNLRTKLETGGQMMTDEQVADYAADFFDREVEGWGRDEVVIEEDEDRDAALGKAKDQTISLAQLHRHDLAPIIEPAELEKPITIHLDGFSRDIIGFIDIVTTDGTVRDTKTSSKSPSADAADKSLQLTFYALAQTAEGRPPKRMTLDYLVKNKTPKSVVVETKRTDVDFQRALNRVAAIDRAISRDAFTPAPEDHWMCSSKWCGYFDDICPFGRKGRVTV